MDNHHSGIKPSPVRHSPADSLNSLRAFTGPPLRPAQQSSAMMQSMHNRTGSHPVADVKPRLTKEQHDILESHFRTQHKPTTNVKKNFAENLGVPLDKINNWFQNRRAKVKQDAKKLQNQQMMYQANLQSYGIQQHQQQPPQLQHQQPQHQHHMSAPNASSYYSTNSSVSPATHPSDNGQPSLDGLNAQFNLQSDYGAAGLTSISESSQNRSSSYNAVIQSLINAGYPMDMTQQQNQFDFDNGTNSSFGSNVSGNGQFLSSLAIPSSGFGNSLDFSAFTPGSTAMQAGDSLGSASTQFTPATQSSLGVHPSGSVTSLQFFDDNSDGGEAFDPNFNAFPHGMPHRHAASTSQISLPFNGSHFNNPGLYQQNNNSSQVIISTPDQYDPMGAFGDLEPPNPPFAFEGFSRRSSSTSNLAESMQTVGIDSRSPSESGSFKQAMPPASIAARRQRRPAPLGASATRSASYTPGMPGSPSNASQTSLNAEQNLRRIRSSQGMNAGRVQKNSTGSAQHSPITFAFNAAINSPKFARELASAVSTPGGNGNFAPPTPQTPNEGARFPSWQTSGEIKPQPSFADTSSPPDSLGINFSAESSSEPYPRQSDVKGASPSVPTEEAQQNQRSLPNVSSNRDTPPQSAPPTQQSFSQGVFVSQTQTTNDFLAPDDFSLHNMRRPSLPESVSHNPHLGNPMQHFGLTNFNSGGPQSMGYPVQYGNVSTFNMPMYSMDSAPSMTSAPAPTQTSPDSSDFLVVHEYAPPNSSGKSNESRRMQEQPKQFVFANAGPNDFQGPS
ncbi:hypothetical protein EJ05DRAFT_176632 [Pseudovirgaria hyperparasitica]|uniref:Homeobox domain-containing protein n=1 Tax=Pseudovirgaria hyperparasitica TaxID=470096 RepID=A0A6A6WHU5_9PEZI|nr:uncharacterized protein EJ05DRAFT_176632 [Pseudovirgaria hyperparasitica]KAF2761566.1 hypothetical protein EJ05DRAFT_176632 [Pseudovirgaria hyperparasitica]